MQNVEYKAELRDPLLARNILLASKALHAETLRQVDTYYRLADGRLKKREITRLNPDGSDGDRNVEVIFYDRRNNSRAKLSRFMVYSTDEAAQRYGERPLTQWVVVRKVREVYLIDNVRVHLDRVEGLGTYLEFEAMVSPERKVPKCYEAVERLRDLLRPALGEPIDCSYSDMLAEDVA